MPSPFTAIEVLSPTNKRGSGREEYLAKRRRILLSPAHLLEIDFLRQGQRVPMQKPLPVVPIPLLPGDDDTPLDLQQIFSATYDLLGYDLAADYSQPPEIPLPDEAATWSAARLGAAGLRN